VAAAQGAVPPEANPSTAPPTSEAETKAADSSSPAAAEAPVEPETQTPGAAVVTPEQIAALQAQIDELKAKQEEAETNALLADDSSASVEADIFKVYGFMDMGAQRYWVNKRSLVGSVFDTNAVTFVTGNIDLYFDFNPSPDWRTLAEVRFTEAPLGNIESYGGIAGTFERTDTQQFDPHGTAPNAPMWGGYTVIERAHIEWNHFQAFRLLVGKFFTPFGIWNVDHGSPTLLSIAMPQFIQQMWMPIRQTGVQALGTFFAGDVEVGYRAWLTNGRTEQNPFDYDDGKAFGARLFARRDGGAINYQIGASYHYGHVRDKVVDVTGISPLLFDSHSTWEYDEHVAGADVSLDLDNTRIRAEAIVRRTDFDQGKQRLVSAGFLPGALEPDKWQLGGYLTVAQQLPWFGLEPYFYGEVMQQPWVAADGLLMLSAGFNWRFTAAAMLKAQATRSMFYDWKYETNGKASVNNMTMAIVRLVVAF